MPAKTRTTRRPTRPKTPARRTAATAEPLECALVVRRGAKRRYQALLRRTRSLPVTVVWDPRKGDRRRIQAGGIRVERRRADRRKASPFPWEIADFFVMFKPVSGRR